VDDEVIEVSSLGTFHVYLTGGKVHQIRRRDGDEKIKNPEKKVTNWVVATQICFIFILIEKLELQCFVHSARAVFHQPRPCIKTPIEGFAIYLQQV